MTSFKFPIAIWTDSVGNTTARTVDGVDACAVGTDEKSTLHQLKRYLVWYFKKTPYGETPDCRDVQVESISVPLRAQNESDRGRFPSETLVNLSFQYVWGKRADGSIACCLPMLGRSFGCSKPGSLKSLVKDEVRQCFADATTSSIARSICPSPIRVDSISIRVDTERYSNDEPGLEILPEVAMPLGDRGNRREFSSAWCREVEVKALKDQLKARRTNVFLIGDRGIGKTTVLAEAVRQLQREEKHEPENKNDIGQVKNRFWLTNASRLIAGMQYLGQWEERVEQMIEELSEINGVLCLENLLQLVQTGSSEPSASLAGFLRHFMLNDELRVVAEGTRDELEAIRRLLPGLDGLFHIINVGSMSTTQSIRVLNSIATHFEQNSKIDVSERAISICQYLFARFMPYDGFPGKCAVFWNKLLREETDGNQPQLGVDRVIEAFVALTGLPEFLVRDEIPLQLSDVEQYFEQRIIGQSEACKTVAQLVVSFKAAMNDPDRPIGVNLFCGPTGVGKTEMAKTLADYMFGAGVADDTPVDRINRLIRLDMSEYSMAGSAEKLLLDQDGQPSKLVQRIRQTPFVVLLLDEIEKAAPEVFDALMTVFDEGRMVDRLGREANFRSCVILLTSNLGTATTDPIGFENEETGGYEKEVRRFFRPEFFNRLDRVIAFDHLDQDSICRIAEKEILQLQQREGLDKRHIQISCTPELIKHVAKHGYDRRLGARPLQRAIESRVVTPLARWLTEHPRAEMCQLLLSFDGKKIRVSQS